MTASPYLPFAPLTVPVVRLYRRGTVPIIRLGHMLVFFIRALVAVPLALRQYRGEFLRLLSNITWGNGSIVVGGGTAGVAVVLGMTVGALVGIEGYNFLDLLGLGPATGFVSSLVNTRELAPLMASLAFAMQGGCRFTAQLGSMRIAEEIDALESIAIRPIPYLVTTRLIASVAAIVPLYVACLAIGYLSHAARGGDQQRRLDRLLPALLHADVGRPGHRLLVDQGRHLRVDRVHDSVLLRVLRDRRARGCRSGRRARHAGQHHRRDHREHVAHHGVVGGRRRRKVRWLMPNSFELDGRGPSDRQLLATGAAVVVVAALLTVAMVVKSTGRLNDYVRVVADLVNVGDGLPQKSDVKYHGVLVGMVDGVRSRVQRKAQLRSHRPERTSSPSRFRRR